MQSHAPKASCLAGRVLLLDQTAGRWRLPSLTRRASVISSRCVVTLDNYKGHCPCWRAHVPLSERDGAATFECLPYQLSIVRYVRPMALTGNGESGFDSGEAAW